MLWNSHPQQQIVIKMLCYQWGIVCKQSNVQIALLNFSLYYEWFKFHYIPQVSQLILILTCRVMMERWSSISEGTSAGDPADAIGDFPCLGCWQITAGSPSGVPWEIGSSPFDRLCFFSSNCTPNSHGSPGGGRQASRGPPPNELICFTPADRLGKF